MASSMKASLLGGKQSEQYSEVQGQIQDSPETAQRSAEMVQR